jgi:enterochelin esterase-like enzyme
MAGRRSGGTGRGGANGKGATRAPIPMKPLFPIAALLLAGALSGVAAQEAPLTPGALAVALAARPTGAAAEALAERVRGFFGREAMRRGPAAKVDELAVAWAIEAPNAAASTPRVESVDGRFGFPMTRIGETPVYAAALTLPEGTAFRWQYDVGGAKLGGGQLEVYRTDPDMLEQSNVPRGRLIQMPPWESKIFEGTRRDWWIYVPAQYRPENPACVMVFQDGAGAKNYTPTCFDNLIAKGQMPVTVGVFISPGQFAGGRSNRSVEYDTLSDKYARFLLEEILPEVEKTAKLKKDPASRAIAGISSGGICAFTVAWERPNEFHKVLSWVGSFTNIQAGPTFKEGGHNYQAMIRKAPKRNIRVFLQDGENDLDNANGNWPLANQEMAKSLAFAGYDYRFVYGQGFHSDRHGRALMPESLRWLWRDYPKP